MPAPSPCLSRNFPHTRPSRTVTAARARASTDPAECVRCNADAYPGSPAWKRPNDEGSFRMSPVALLGPGTTALRTARSIHGLRYRQGGEFGWRQSGRPVRNEVLYNRPSDEDSDARDGSRRLRAGTQSYESHISRKTVCRSRRSTHPFLHCTVLFRRSLALDRSGARVFYGHIGRRLDARRRSRTRSQ